MKKYMTVKMGDGSVWVVPTETIARNRAERYKHKYGGDVERSLIEDTIPKFNEDQYEIEEWAEHKMYWEQIKNEAIQLKGADEVDYEHGWYFGDKTYIDDLPVNNI